MTKLAKTPKPHAGGNTGKPVTQTATGLKLDTDLYEWLLDYEGESRNKFINTAVRQQVERLTRLLADVDSDD